MGVADEELFNPIVFFGGGGLLAATAAFLGAVFAQRLALDVAAVAECDHHVGGRDQVFGGQILGVVLDVAAASTQLALAELLANGCEFLGNDGRDAFWAGQDVEQVVNFSHDFFVLVDDLVLLQAGQALQAHLQNFVGLGVAQAVEAIGAHAVLLFQTVGAVVVGVDDATIGFGAGQHGAHQLAVPGLAHQFNFGHRWCGRIADDGNEFVNIGQSHCQAFEHMAAFPCFSQIEHGATRHHFATVLQENGDQVFQIAQTRLAVDQRHHVHAEGVL